MASKPYNPLDKIALARSIEAELLSRPAEGLGDFQPVAGAGVYVIYYRGPFELYRPLTDANANDLSHPIYVGKAIPEGGRKGGLIVDAAASGSSLQSRLRKHAESVRAVKSLAVADFFVRSLVLDDIWIPLGESLLITQFSPLWNSLIDGFGNHDPGSGRYKGLRPRWDVLHPGRAWADKCQPRQESVQDIKNDVEEFFRARDDRA